MYFSHGRQTCKTARAILYVDFTVPSQTMFTQLRWMAFKMYTTVCGDAPDYLKMICFLTSEIHLRLLRSSSNFQLYTPRPSTELYRNSFIFSGTSIWNSIPDYIKTARSVKHFKPLYLRWYKQSSEN